LSKASSLKISGLSKLIILILSSRFFPTVFVLLQFNCSQAVKKELIMNSPKIVRLTIFLLWLGIISVSPGTAQTNASCFAPGNLVVSDAGSDTLLPQHDIESVRVAEPISSDNSQKLVFTLKIQKLNPLPLASWNVIFAGPDNITRFVQMSTLSGSPQFRYGTLTSLLGIPVFNYEGNNHGTFSNDGTIGFYVDKNLVGNFSVGQTASVSARVYIKPLIDLIEVDNASASNYTFVGNENCSPFQFKQLGANGDVPVTNDYNRNSTADFAVWRPSNGLWMAVDGITSESVNFQWGNGSFGDIPVPGHYDNDGKGDFAVFRPSTGTWYIYKTETNNYQIINFGVAEDLPLSGDYDGDRIDDIAVFRPSNGVWYVLNSLDASVKIVQFGLNEDRPVSGDFDGDRRADIAVWRPSNGVWYVLRSSNNSFFAVNFGIGTDVVAAEDYDGDGKTDCAVWRPETGYWYVLRSSDLNAVAFKWGVSTDRVSPADFNGNGRADFAVWRPDTAVWYVYLN
jgi:hypothetical protein